MPGASWGGRVGVVCGALRAFVSASPGAGPARLRSPPWRCTTALSFRPGPPGLHSAAALRAGRRRRARRRPRGYTSNAWPSNRQQAGSRLSPAQVVRFGPVQAFPPSRVECGRSAPARNPTPPAGAHRFMLRRPLVGGLVFFPAMAGTLNRRSRVFPPFWSAPGAAVFQLANRAGPAHGGRRPEHLHKLTRSKNLIRIINTKFGGSRRDVLADPRGRARRISPARFDPAARPGSSAGCA